MKNKDSVFHLVRLGLIKIIIFLKMKKDLEFKKLKC